DALQASMRDAGWQPDVIAAALAEPLPPQLPVVVVPLPGPDLTHAPLEIEAVDRRVQVLQTLAHPRVVVFGNLLSDAECDGLIEGARARLSRSLTVETQTGGEALNVDRTSDGMFFARGETEIVARLEARIASLLRWPIA